LGKFERSLALVVGSFRVLRRNKSLMLLPVAGFVAEAAFFGAIAAIALATGGLEHWARLVFDRSISSLAEVTVIDVVLLTTTWVGATFIAVLFNAVLMAAVFQGFDGEPTGLRQGFQAVKPRLGNILGWAIVAGVVGLLLNVLYRKGGIAGAIVSWVIDVAWAFATVFVVPILVLKDVTPVQALRESAGLFRRTWGEQVIGGLGIGLAFLGVWIVAIVVTVTIALSAGVVAAAIVGVPLLGALIAAQSAIGTIFTAALYRWATDGAVPTDFEGVDFHSAYKPKKDK